jgi:HemY protein
MARALNARRDPAWTADGFVSDRWLPVSPVTGRLDAFEWKDPLAGRDHAGAMIDAEQRAMLDAPRARPAIAAGAAAIAAGAGVAAGAGTSSAVHPDVAQTAPHPTPLPASLPTSGKPDVGGERESTESAAHTAVESPTSTAAPAPVETPIPPDAPPPDAPTMFDTASPQAEERAADEMAPPPVIPLVHAPDDPGPDHEVAPEPEVEPAPEPPPDAWSRIRSLFKP